MEWTMNRGVLLVGLTLDLIFVVGFHSAAKAQGRKSAPRVGQPAPNVSFLDVNGRQVNLGDFKGKKNVLAVVHRGWVGYW